MKTFLIQTIHGEVQHDFAFELIQSIRYHNWYHRETVYEFVTSDEPLYEGNISDCIPVGSLEFVFSFMEKYYDIPKENIRPINIPLELQMPLFLGRKYEEMKQEEMDFQTEKFVKSAEQYKTFTELVCNSNEVPKGEYVVSDVIPIESEWRTFVFQKKMVGLQNYAGDFTLFPNVNQIQHMIDAYYDCPPAYTLDVGVNEQGTFVIEVHPFVSCGLYGFKEHKYLPMMFTSAFRDFVRTFQKK